MKLFHIADLHIGKKMNGHPLREDQRYILDRIVGMAKAQAPDAVLIAGDVYDRSDPSAESVSMLDDFLTKLSEVTKVLLISGNHDSPERLTYARRFLASRGVYISPVYDGHVQSVDLFDEYGAVHFYLLPFIRPSSVRRFFGEAKVDTFTDAVRTAVQEMNIDTVERNVLLSHQFVTGARLCDSEDVVVGGLDNVDASAYDGFDYVALGHIHTPQDIRSDRARIRYCGTPLKYSFSEAESRKSVTVVNLGEKGKVIVEELPLAPYREVSKISGAFDEIREKSWGEARGILDHYLSVTLTDENEALNAFQTLRSVYGNILQLSYAKTGNTTEAEDLQEEDIAGKGPLELFMDFYRQQNGDDMSEEQVRYVADLVEKLEEQA